MEKLIELIGEWQEELHPDGIYLPVVAYRDGIFWSDSDCLSSVMDEIHLISKPCGFIQWLVENDKIDTDKLDKKSERKPMYSFEEEGKIGFKLFEVYETLLMLLSISDTPIEDLISYLK